LENTTKFRIGSVPYLNAAPLTRGLESELIFATPAKLAEMLRRINLDLPRWLIASIDRVVGRNGLARQSQIKAWLADKIKETIR